MIRQTDLKGDASGASAQRPTEEAPMDRFVHRANLDRFRQILARTTDEAERQRIAKLLAEEEAKNRLPPEGE
jgi:hypothetical protein